LSGYIKFRCEGKHAKRKEKKKKPWMHVYGLESHISNFEAKEVPEESKLNSEVQKEILKAYYQKWRDFSLWFAAGTMELEGVKKDNIIANAEYLVKQGLIKSPQTGNFLSAITIYGIDYIEDKKISEDVAIRKKTLQELNDQFEKDPQRRVMLDKIVERLGCSKVEIQRNLWYLEHKGLAEVQWGLGGWADAEITGLGIEALKEPSILEQETRFMSNAYSSLYQLENELRIFIEKKLSEKYDEEWWQKGVPLRVRRNAEQNKEKEPESSLGLLYYTEFSDLRKIIQKEENWHTIFKECFRTLEQIISRLDELEQIRHTIAHTRLLSNVDFEKLDLFYREIRKMIGKP
jgi:hypothetical protein